VVYSLISGLFGSLAPKHTFDIVNVDLVKASTGGMLSITVKDTGSQVLELVAVSIVTDSGEVKGPKVKVLDVYPVQPFVQTVISNDGLGLFSVTSIDTSTFNGGSYDLSLYDVVILDVVDGGQNLDNEEQNAIKNFVSQGGGFVATHDWVTYVGRNPILWEVLGVDNTQPNWYPLSTVYRTREGTITSYPHVLPSSMNVLWTHTTNQHILTATRWFELTADNSGDDFYLITNFYGKGKSAMLQWGHTATAPSAGSPESKCIINTLYWAGTKKAEPGQTVSMTLTGLSVTNGVKYPVTLTVYWTDGSTTTKTITATCW
jgi:hypothetical protein